MLSSSRQHERVGPGQPDLGNRKRHPPEFANANINAAVT
jgi:hypothetical protein